MRLRYGRGVVEAALPEPFRIIEPPAAEPLSDPSGELVRAADSPLCSPPLSAIIRRGRGEIRIVVADKTRKSAYPVLLPALLDRLNELGVPDGEIVLIVASGVHERQGPREDRETYGGKTLGRVRLAHHDCDGPTVRLGVTKRGTPVELSETAAGAGVLLTLGAATHHYFAGFGGGPKLLVPGLASRRTVLANHSLAIDREERRFHPACAPGNVAGNPVREDLLEAASFRPPDLAFHTVLAPDGRPARIVAGDMEKAHGEACRIVDSLYSVPVNKKEKYPWVLASCGGFPKDIDLVQAHKSLFNAAGFARDVALLLLLARCPDGVGSETLLDWCRYEKKEALVEALLKKYDGNGGTALSLKEKTERLDVRILSTLPEETVRKAAMKPLTLRELSDGSLIEGRGAGLVLTDASLAAPRN